MPPLTPIQFTELQAAVLDAFTPEELGQVVRFKLGRRLDVLVNVNQATDQIVVDLIGRVERLGWTEELVRGVYEARPDHPGVKQFCDTHARFVFTPALSTQALARTVEAGLVLVTNQLNKAGGADRALLTDAARNHLQHLSTQFERLRKYKILHDCLHNLQFKYARLITSGLRLFRESPDEADNLRILFAEMADKLSKTRPEANGLPSAAAETLWLKVAEEAIRRLGAGVQTGDLKAAEGGYQLLEGVLRVQPTRINELLTGVLEDLQFEHLLAALALVLERLGVGGATLVAPLTVAVSSVRSLTPRLNRVTSDHKDWQLVDNTLLQIETDLKLGYSVEQCAFLWQEAERILQPLLDQDRAAAWTQELRQLGGDFAQALRGANAEQVKAAFRRLRPRAMWYFFQADADLKNLSAELIKVGNQLDLLLKGVGDDGN